ncbi:MAG: type I DNA topoisomerase [Alphaproteobacteria bacterium]|nr:type I DNA topoisomerase [Alphaproteobacteria bacterium]
MSNPNALVIVESPAKAKTIEGYLGKGYKVLASFGHVRDLPSKEKAVEPDNDFAMHYQVSDAKSEQTLKGIMAALKDVDTLYLATDLDREGEAISWHVWEEIKRRNPKKAATLHVHRIEFTEITKTALQQALRQPRSLALNLINAQQARRALDYLVGFTLSPVLWRKVKGGLSAGRVQSVALRLIAEREDAIEAFKPEEFWTLHGQFTTASGKPLPGNLVQYAGKKVEKFSFTTEDQAKRAQTALLPNKYAVQAVERADKRRFPSPPFITSSLQMEAARKLGFAARRTMQTAQRLYEAGHITYMRTDSVNLANEAVAALRSLIGQKYGAEYVPSQPIVYKSKSKNAQEAHEAIRPTNPSALPNQLGLEDDQFKLYNLIWQRTLACQMAPARLEQTTITITSQPDQFHHFRATGSVVLFPGFLAAYQEGKDDDADEDGEALLPAVKEGEALQTPTIDAEQHFTQPPPRFTEATLVKALEEYGIGRPSTYASIIATLQDRGYVRLEQKRFFPEDVGRIVSKFLVEHFGQYVDYNFTAEMEDDLDAIARGEHDWKPTLRRFWQPFKSLTVEKMESVKKSDVTTEATGEVCPQCGVGELVYRLGRYGRFKGCNRYPECNYIEKSGPAATPGETTGLACPQCVAQNLPNQGELVKKTSRLGKIFWSCSTYPADNYAVWDEPVKGPCPKCSWGIITKKISKKYGEWHRCPNCDWNDNQEAADATAAFRARFTKGKEAAAAKKIAAKAKTPAQAGAPSAKKAPAKAPKAATKAKTAAKKPSKAKR